MIIYDISHSTQKTKYIVYTLKTNTFTNAIVKPKIKIIIRNETKRQLKVSKHLSFQKQFFDESLFLFILLINNTLHIY